MLGLFILYLVGKGFYDLAEKHSRTGWGHAILGVAIYYLTQFIFGVLAYVVMDLTTSFDSIDSYQMQITLISIPVSALACWGYYQFIKNRWENSANKQEAAFDSDLLDDDILFS